MLFKKEYSKNPIKGAIVKQRCRRGLNDLLSYLRLVDESTILHKDGALSRHFCYLAPDLDSSTDEALDYHAQTWSLSFGFLGNGWMVETNVVSFPFHNDRAPQEFPELVSALMDDERRKHYQGGHYFKTHTVLSLTWKPQQKMESTFRRFAIEGKPHRKNDLDETLLFFNKTVNEVIGFLKRALVSIEPLSDSKLTSFLHQTITGLHHPITKPYPGAFLDSYLASLDFIAGFEPVIGKKHIKVLALDDLPLQSYPGLLESLSYFPLAYRWCNRFIPLDKLTANTYLKRFERNWSSKAIGILGVLRESLDMPPKIDEDAQHTANLLKEAQIENSAGHNGYGFYNSTVVLMHEDKGFLHKVSEDIMNHIQQLNFRVRDESVNATEAYLGTLPCHGDYNLRKMLVDTHYVGHAFPTSAVYQGEAKAPCRKEGYRNKPGLLVTTTQGTRPFWLNLHVGDVGHTAILGPTGQGKTTLVGAIMMSHRQYPGSRVIVLDKDESNRIPLKALGGDYIDLSHHECQLGALSRLTPNNLQEIDGALEWLSGLCQIQGVDVTPKRQEKLREALNRLAKEKQSYKNLNHLAIQEPEIREAIRAFNSGRIQQLVNGTTPALGKKEVIGIAMGTLMQGDNKERDLSIPVIKALFNELQHVFQDKKPTLLILEEAWAYLRHPLFREKLTDWFKTLRKFNVAVIFISQDLDDIVKSDAASTIQTSCMTRIYLPNSSATEEVIAQQYRAFGLNARQIDIIQQAIPKQDYYYQSPRGHRLFSLDLQAVAKAFLGVSEKSEIKRFDALYKKDNPRWVLEWLQWKGLKDWHDFALKNYFGKEHGDA